MHDQTDTIVAVSTAPGRGAVALIRASGPFALSIAAACLRLARPLAETPRCQSTAEFVNAGGEPLDQVLACFFPAPASYTGQDVIEICCHGSPPVTRALLETLVHRGMRLAEPGEFTWRAFLNGKMDLAQAEAVRDLINSQTEFQARVAREQLQGRLSRLLEPVRAEFVRIMSHLETTLEFVEDDVSPEGRASLAAAIESLRDRLGGFETGFHFGRLLQEGAVISIVGRPNAGKSSLFNALLREERAIVTDIPGTTRDAVAESLHLAGIPAHLIDTAGLREATNVVERLGVEKSLDYLRRSDAVCFVVDVSEPWSDADALVWDAVRGMRCVLVLNKADLPERLEAPEEVRSVCAAVLRVSAREGTNLEQLREALARVISEDRPAEQEVAIVTDLREQECLRRARAHTERALVAYAGERLSEEYVLYDLRRALDAVGEVTGATTTEEILDAVFATFCIGK